MRRRLKIGCFETPEIGRTWLENEIKYHRKEGNEKDDDEEDSGDDDDDDVDDDDMYTN